MTDQPGQRPEDRLPVSSEPAPVVPRGPAATERFTAPPTAHSVGLSPERAAKTMSAFGALRRFEQLLARIDIFTTATREIEVMLGLVPGALELGEQMRAGRVDEQRIRRKERRHRETLTGGGVFLHLAVDG